MLTGAGLLERMGGELVISLAAISSTSPLLWWSSERCLWVQMKGLSLFIEHSLCNLFWDVFFLSCITAACVVGGSDINSKENQLTKLNEQLRKLYIGLYSLRFQIKSFWDHVFSLKITKISLNINNNNNLVFHLISPASNHDIINKTNIKSYIGVFVLCVIARSKKLDA